MFDKQKKKVNLSYTFMIKNICKYCMGSPSFYYFTRGKKSYESPTQCRTNFNSSYMNIRDIYYEMIEPKVCRNNDYFKFSLDMGYCARIHKNLGANKYGGFIDHATCKCGKTHWAFPQSLSLKRPDIVNRSSRALYPFKLSWD
jgi:hypothetical protein